MVGKRCEKYQSRNKTYVGLAPHDMRRSAAKAGRRAGIPESVLMKMGGWKKASMLCRYAIVSDVDRRASVQALDRARVEPNSPAFGPAEVKSHSRRDTAHRR